MVAPPVNGTTPTKQQQQQQRQGPPGRSPRSSAMTPNSAVSKTAGKRRKLPKSPASPAGVAGGAARQQGRSTPPLPRRRSESMEVELEDDDGHGGEEVREGRGDDNDNIPGNGDDDDDGDDEALRRNRETRAMIEDEKPLVRQALEQLRDRAKEVEEKVSFLLQRAEREATEDPGLRVEGASFLGAKQTLLLSYCRELCSYAAAKGKGQPLRGEGPSRRLVELRTVMEKLRPMDRKLKYQTDKLLRLASSTRVSGSGGVTFADKDDDEEDPLSFRPRPEGMAAWGDNTNGEIADGDVRESGGKKKSGGAISSQSASAGDDSGLYRAPRLSSVPYDVDGVSAEGSGAARGEKRLEKRREKIRRGEVMETLREEFGEQPESVRAVGNAGKSGVSEAKMKRLLEEDKERLDFEEDHMVRLTVTRKAKKARAQMEKDAGRLETIADVGSAADFVRVAKDADGFGVETEGGEDAVFGGGNSRKGRGKRGAALGRAMGAVGGSMSGQGTGDGRGGGKKSKRRRA